MKIPSPQNDFSYWKLSLSGWSVSWQPVERGTKVVVQQELMLRISVFFAMIDGLAKNTKISGVTHNSFVDFGAFTHGG